MRSGYVCLRTDDVLTFIAGRNFKNVASLSFRLTGALFFLSFLLLSGLSGLTYRAFGRTKVATKSPKMNCARRTTPRT